MKNFDFLLCFLLCVLPCVFTLTMDERMIKAAKGLDITVEDLQECLNKANTDLVTMMDISDAALGGVTPPTKDTIKKVGCFGACVFKKNGMMVNSKIMVEKFVELLSERIRRPEHALIVRTAATECAKRVSSNTDECDIAISFSRCAVEEMSREN